MAAIINLPHRQYKRSKKAQRNVGIETFLVIFEDPTEETDPLISISY